MRLQLQPQLIEFEESQKARWKDGDRTDCLDPYCRKSPATYGFGEFLVGRHFEENGYSWVHHDFDIFGTNKPGKYPKSEEVLLEALGADRLAAMRSFHSLLLPFKDKHHAVETPDLLVFRKGTSGTEVRFAEVKRTDTRDKVHPRQLIGLCLIASLLHVAVDVFVVSPAGNDHRPPPLVFIELP